AIYRDANERIKSAAEEYEVGGPIPFICECADPECRSVVLLTMSEYEEIRAQPNHFLNLPGHDEIAAGHTETVRTAPSYIVVEKSGAPATSSRSSIRGRHDIDERARRVGENEALFRSVNE